MKSKKELLNGYRRHPTVLVALAVIVISLISANPVYCDRQQQNPPLTASLVSMQWFAVPFGSFLHLGSEKRMMRRDLVALKLAVKVENHTTTKQDLPMRFVILNNKNTETSLERYSATYKKIYTEPSLSIPASSTQTVYLQCILKPLERLINNPPLRVVHKSYKWHWDVIPLPKHGDFYSVAEHSKIFSFHLLKQKWDGVPAGTKVMVGGRQGIIKSNVTGLVATIRVTNINKKQQKFEFPIILLVGKGYVPVKLMKLKEVSRSKLKQVQNKGIVIKSDQSLDLVVTSAMKGYEKFKSLEPLHLEIPKYRWLLPLEHIPGWESIEK